MFPQLPQLLLSVERLTHVPEQLVCPVGQMVVEVVLEVVVDVVLWQDAKPNAWVPASNACSSDGIPIPSPPSMLFESAFAR